MTDYVNKPLEYLYTNIVESMVVEKLNTNKKKNDLENRLNVNSSGDNASVTDTSLTFLSKSLG